MTFPNRARTTHAPVVGAAGGGQGQAGVEARPSTSKCGPAGNGSAAGRAAAASIKPSCSPSVMADPDNPCKPLACDIQACIQKHQFQQEKCEHLVQRLYKCCATFYRENGRDKECVSCPKPDAVDRKMKTWGWQ